MERRATRSQKVPTVPGISLGPPRKSGKRHKPQVEELPVEKAEEQQEDVEDLGVGDVPAPKGRPLSTAQAQSHTKQTTLRAEDGSLPVALPEMEVPPLQTANNNVLPCPPEFNALRMSLLPSGTEASFRDQLMRRAPKQPSSPESLPLTVPAPHHSALPRASPAPLAKLSIPKPVIPRLNLARLAQERPFQAAGAPVVKLGYYGRTAALKKEFAKSFAWPLLSPPLSLSLLFPWPILPPPPPVLISFLYTASIPFLPISVSGLAGAHCLPPPAPQEEDAEEDAEFQAEAMEDPEVGGRRRGNNKGKSKPKEDAPPAEQGRKGAPQKKQKPVAAADTDADDTDEDKAGGRHKAGPIDQESQALLFGWQEDLEAKVEALVTKLKKPSSLL
ncbi:hypothetical protein DFH09DRAFT_1318799 [Mycena vulgaris]|nr:hypothetical protein DFH09DRAFT_1318799 [Mycena vulgaris]